MPFLARLCLLIPLATAPGLALAELSDAFAASVTPAPAERPVGPAALAGLGALDRQQSYVVIAQPVQTVLEHVAREAGLRLTLSDKVKGLVRNLRASGRTDQILDAVCDQKGLEWFAFNDMIYVSARNEATTRLVKLGDLSSEQAVAALEDAGIPSESVETRSTSAGAVLALSGPPDLLAIAEALIESLPPTAAIGPKANRAPMVLIRRGNQEGWVTLRRHSVATYRDQ
jgi:hypothetical protein